MHAFDAAESTYYCAAMVGAAAALTGLLFVAVSLNLDHILKGPKFLPQRAAEALASLLFVLSASAFGLVPQNIRLVGAEILVVVVPLLVITLRSQPAYRNRHTDDPLLWLVSRMSATAMATVPGLLAEHLARHALGRWPLLARAPVDPRHRRRRLQRVGPARRDRPLGRVRHD